MAGLMDFLATPEARMGIGLLSAGGPQTDPTKTGLGFALQSMNDAKDAYDKQQMAKLIAQSQLMENVGQAQARMATARAAQAKAEALANPFNPDGSVNFQGLLGAEMKPDDINKIAQWRTGGLGAPEVARVEEISINGVPMKQAYDKTGNKIGEPVPAWKAPIQTDQGGSITFRSGSDPTQVIGTVEKTNTPGELLGAETSIYGTNMSAQTARGNALLADQRAATTAAQAGGKMTEDQSKVASLLTEAERSLANIKAVAIDKNGKLTSVVNPGLGDAIQGMSWIPGSEGFGRLLMGSDRESFNINMKRISDVLLRAATGAGMNVDEAKDAVKKYVPQWGESAKNKAQKINDIPVFMEGLRQRAGLQGAQAAAAAQNTAPIVSLPGSKASDNPQQASKLVSVNGTQMMAKRGVDGRFYVTGPDGRAYPVNE